MYFKELWGSSGVSRSFSRGVRSPVKMIFSKDFTKAIWKINYIDLIDFYKKNVKKNIKN